MQTCLKIIIGLSFCPILCWAKLPPEHDLITFANSKPWRKIYQYKKTLLSIIDNGRRSISRDQAFFFHEKGQRNPLLELKKSFKVFNDFKTKFGHIKKPAQCAFPARYQLLKRRFPQYFKRDQPCPELKKWLEKLNVEKITIGFAGAYPNNPASMFGHSFLRLHNPKRHYLNHYNLSFLANTENDHSLLYAYKGIMGGYTGYFQLKPYYESMAQYNNSESRDIWEYPLKLSKEEIEQFLKHLWEVKFNTGLPYYFFTKNCSYYLLSLIEGALPNKDYIRQMDKIVLPLETIKISATNKDHYLFRPAIKRIINNKIKQMSKKEKKLFEKTLYTKSSPTNARVLDAQIDYWKMKTYEEKTNLNEKENNKVKEINTKRSKLEHRIHYPPIEKDNIIKTHKPSSIKTSYIHDRKNDKNHFKITSKWLYHGLYDSENHFSEFDFIEFMKLSLVHKNGKTKLDQFNFVDITSLENFTNIFKNISWRATLDLKRSCYLCQNKLTVASQMGVGLSKRFFHSIIWALYIINPSYQKKRSLILNKLELGLKAKEIFGVINLAIKSHFFYKDNRIRKDIQFGISKSLLRDFSSEFIYHTFSEANLKQLEFAFKYYY